MAYARMILIAALVLMQVNTVYALRIKAPEREDARARAMGGQ